MKLPQAIPCFLGQPIASRILIPVLLAASLDAARLSADETPLANHNDRRQFAAAMAKLTPGMSAAEIKAILGEPDDIRMQFDPGGPTGQTGFSVVEDIRSAREPGGRPISPFTEYHLAEIWAYGTVGHLTTATLGMVYLDDDGRMREIVGNKGEPPPPGMFQEVELRRWLRVLAQVPP